MNHNQSIRARALRLLYDHGILQFEQDSATGQQSLYELAYLGWQLVKELAEKLNLDLLPLKPDNVLLQGSLSTFQPIDGGDNDVLAGIIAFNRKLPPEERVFAVAHEIGQAILHKDLVYCHSFDLENTEESTAPFNGQVEVYNPRNLREREANLFALELTMPGPAIRSQYLKYLEQCSRNCRGHPDALDFIARFFSIEPNRVLLQLVNVFLLPAPSASEPITSRNKDVVPRHGSTPRPTVGSPTGSASGSKEFSDRQMQAIKWATPLLLCAGQ
jgi:Zn-dependent peptidase ImmA (M78 family)